MIKVPIHKLLERFYFENGQNILYAHTDLNTKKVYKPQNHDNPAGEKSFYVLIFKEINFYRINFG